jgi:lipoprotein NlpI
LSAGQQSKRVEQSCEADFFAGVYQIEKGAPADARPQFQSAVDHCPRDFVQYPAAKFELAQVLEQARKDPGENTKGLPNEPPDKGIGH